MRHSSEIDPLDFGKIKIGGINRYNSYFSFATNAENEISSQEADVLNRLKQNEKFEIFLSFLETLLPARRIEEWCILEQLCKKIPKANFSF